MKRVVLIAVMTAACGFATLASAQNSGPSTSQRAGASAVGGAQGGRLLTRKIRPSQRAYRRSYNRYR